MVYPNKVLSTAGRMGLLLSLAYWEYTTQILMHDSVLLTKIALIPFANKEMPQESIRVRAVLVYISMLTN